MFWRKVLDSYVTSIDYDPAAEASLLFCRTVQNKMHRAAYGHTTAEVIAACADATQPKMGPLSWSGDAARPFDVAITKNYLHTDDLEALNRIVTAYLEFAELQALNRRPMRMADWIAKLDDFLRLSERDILLHAGRVSHDAAVRQAEAEYTRFAAQRSTHPTLVDLHFQEAVSQTNQIAKTRAAKARLPSRKPR